MYYQDRRILIYIRIENKLYFSILYYNLYFRNKYSFKILLYEREGKKLRWSRLYYSHRRINVQKEVLTEQLIQRSNFRLLKCSPEQIERDPREWVLEIGNGGCRATLGVVVVAAPVIAVGESSKVSRGCWVAAMLDSCRRANPWCLLVIVARDATTPPDRRRHALRIADGPMTPGRRDAGVHQ